jgi:hypothetical protein
LVIPIPASSSSDRRFEQRVGDVERQKPERRGGGSSIGISRATRRPERAMTTSFPVSSRIEQFGQLGLRLGNIHLDDHSDQV